MPNVVGKIVVGGWVELVVLRVWDDAAVSNARPLEQFLDVPVPVARRVGVEFVEVVVVGLDVLPVCWAVVAPVLSVDPLPPTRFAGARVVLDEFRSFEAVSVPGGASNDCEAPDPPDCLFVAGEVLGRSRVVGGASVNVCGKALDVFASAVPSAKFVNKLSNYRVSCILLEPCVDRVPG